MTDKPLSQVLVIQGDEIKSRIASGKIVHELVCPFCGDAQAPEFRDIMGLCCHEVGHCEWKYRDEDGNEYTKEEYEAQV